MSEGISPVIPLAVTSIDGAYSLFKDPLEAIKQNIKMIVLTSPGERVFVPSFGVGIRNFLFENFNNSTRSLLSQKIKEQIRTYAPYVSINRVNIRRSEDVVDTVDNTLAVTISYSVPSLRAYEQTIDITVTPLSDS